ncbi:MAG: UbiX family flavin prenyltransferase [Planctomycetes bacterium]|nr:UbiX family flavin prenyltransferase [Planctomycetota bacterium]
MTRFFVGLTGASGHAYARALVKALVDAGHAVDLSVTEAGAKVLRHELGIDAGARGERFTGQLAAFAGKERVHALRAFPSDAIEAPPSSGTALGGGVILCPCSMGTLSRVSIGFSSNLVERAADVALKEGRKLVLVPRETPLSVVHLENLLRVARLGATVLPAMPGFYHHPASVDDLVRHVVGKILDRLGVEHAVSARWKGLARPAEEAEIARPVDAATGDPEARPARPRKARAKRRGGR